MGKLKLQPVKVMPDDISIDDVKRGNLG